MEVINGGKVGVLWKNVYIKGRNLPKIQQQKNNKKITTITIYIAHSLSIFTNLGHFMYPLINKFLLQRPFLDLEDIPMFYSLFHSSTENYQKEKVWILRLLSAGLKTYDVSIL